MKHRISCFVLLVFATALASLATAQPAVPGSRKQPDKPPEKIAPPNRIFDIDSLIRLPLPDAAGGKWVLTDERARPVRSGQFRPAEKTLYLGGLDAGAYVLFWSLDGVSTPTFRSEWPHRTTFLVLPSVEEALEDHFFTICQPHLQSLAATPPNSAPGQTYTFILNHLARLGVSRVRTEWSLPTPDADGNRDFSVLDRLDRDLRIRNIRVLAEIGSAPARSSFSIDPVSVPTPAEAAETVTALMRQYGFRLDRFALWPRPNTGAFPGDPNQFLAWRGAAYRTAKSRSPYCMLFLGGIACDPQSLNFPDPGKLLPLLTSSDGAATYDVLDFDAPGSFRDSRALARAMDALTTGTASAVRPRAISATWTNGPTDTLADQHGAAMELTKKLVWFRSQGFVSIGAPPLLGPPDEQPFPESTALFASDGLIPRLSALAWFQARLYLAQARPVPRLAYEDEKILIVAFERSDETIFVAWAPQIPGDNRPDKRVSITIGWPDEIAFEIRDFYGRSRTETHHGQIDPNRHYILVDEEPEYLTIHAPSDQVTW